MSEANKRQIGGSHYKDGGDCQHWDVVSLYGVGYLEGCATKYVSRWHKKNGVQDLEKGLHYIEKLIEILDSGKTRKVIGMGMVPDEVVIQFAAAYTLDRGEYHVCKRLFQWKNREDLKIALNVLRIIIEEARSPQHISAGMGRCTPVSHDYLISLTGPGTPEDGSHYGRITEEDDGA